MMTVSNPAAAVPLSRGLMNWATRATPGRTWRVVVIDDSETHRVQLRAIIEKKGHCSVKTFADGTSNALDCIEEWADLVVIDQMMPGCSGLEFVERMRHRPRLAKMPVVMITSDHTLDMRRTALARGVHRLETKPVRPDDVRRAVSDLLERPHRRLVKAKRRPRAW